MRGAVMSNIKEIRRVLGLSAREFAALIGYDDDRTIRRIEKGERSISGSAAKLLTYIIQCVPADGEALPEHLICAPARREGPFADAEFVFRTHRPRFIGAVTEAPIDGLSSVALADGAEYLSVFLWIDEPTGFDEAELLRRAATDFAMYTQDAFAMAEGME